MHKIAAFIIAFSNIRIMYFDHIPPASVSGGGGVCVDDTHVCVQVHACVWKCVYMWVPGCRGQSQVSFAEAVHLVLWDGALTDLGLVSGADWLASKLQGLPVSSSPYWDYKHVLPCWFFLKYYYLHGAGDLTQVLMVHSNYFNDSTSSDSTRPGLFPLSPPFLTTNRLSPEGGAPLWERIIPSQWIFQKISSQTHPESCLLIDSRSS